MKKFMISILLLIGLMVSGVGAVGFRRAINVNVATPGANVNVNASRGGIFRAPRVNVNVAAVGGGVGVGANVGYAGHVGRSFGIHHTPVHHYNQRAIFRNFGYVQRGITGYASALTTYVAPPSTTIVSPEASYAPGYSVAPNYTPAPSFAPSCDTGSCPPAQLPSYTPAPTYAPSCSYVPPPQASYGCCGGCCGGTAMSYVPSYTPAYTPSYAPVYYQPSYAPAYAPGCSPGVAATLPSYGVGYAPSYGIGYGVGRAFYQNRAFIGHRFGTYGYGRGASVFVGSRNVRFRGRF